MRFIKYLPTILLFITILFKSLNSQSTTEVPAENKNSFHSNHPDFRVIDTVNLNLTMNIFSKTDPVDDNNSIKFYLKTQQNPKIDQNQESQNENSENLKNQQNLENNQNPQGLKNPDDEISQEANYIIEYRNGTNQFRFGQIIPQGEQVDLSKEEIHKEEDTFENGFENSNYSQIKIQGSTYTSFKLEDDLYHLEFSLTKTNCLFLFAFVSEQKPRIQISADQNQKMLFFNYQNIDSRFSRHNFFSTIGENSGFMGLQDLFFVSKIKFDPTKPKFLNLICPFWQNIENPEIVFKIEFKLLRLLPFHYGIFRFFLLLQLILKFLLNYNENFF